MVGFDLGTTNSAVTYVDTAEEPWRIKTFAVPQVVAPGQVEARETLPSFHYQAAAGELASGALRCPWHGMADVPSDAREPTWAVGFFARDQGTLAPGRLINSAKSWLCHTGVDRTAALLPWHGAADVERLSPIEVERPLSGPRPRRLEPPLSAPSAGRAGVRADAAGLVRRSGPRVDGQGGGPGGAAAGGVDRGAAGRLLRLDLRPCRRLGATGFARPEDSGLRHRRRHVRFHADSRPPRRRGKSAVPSRGGGRSLDPRRRQPRSDAGHIEQKIERKIGANWSRDNGPCSCGPAAR